MRLAPIAERCLVAAIVLAVALCLVGCAKKEAPPPVVGEAPSHARTAAPPAAPPADEPPAAPETEAPVTLTAELLDQWLASMGDPKVKAILAELKPPGKVSLTEIAANADKAGAHPGLEEAVKAYGYTSGAEWAAVTKRVHAGLIPMQIKAGQEQMKAKMDDPAQVERMMTETNAKLEEAKTAFGELTEEEMKVIEGAADKLGATGG